MKKLDILKEKYTDIPDLYFECGDGWADLLEPPLEAINEFNKENKDNLTRIIQIKEKFGTLRFYTNGHTDEIDKLISEAETLSETTCEICGQLGKSRSGKWIRTLCEDCNK